MLICHQSGCPFAKSGRCLEGQEPAESCPNLVATSSDVSVSSEADSEKALAGQADAVNEAEMCLLHDGLELDGREISAITRTAPATIVVIAGDADSGKTTLLNSVYEQFLRGPFAGLRFSGCRTFVGYEKRCFLSRMRSGRTEPDTARTKTSGVRYLHLSVQPESEAETSKDILFADFPGEYYRVARNSIVECQRLEFLRRMDFFIVLIDGEKLLSPSTRHLAVSQGRTLLRVCIDAGMLSKDTHVMIVVSKIDLVDLKGASAREFIETNKAKLLEQFGSRIPLLSFHEVAARPDAKANLRPGHGVDQLARMWASPRFVEKSPALIPPGKNVRQFDRILERWGTKA